MIKELTWDSAFFKRKIGELVPASRNTSSIKKMLDQARRQGYAYLTCKMKNQDTALIRVLESHGFYLTDIGVILTIKTPLHHPLRKGGRERDDIRKATDRDIPMLKRMSKSLFPESRFYRDPFFSKNEADRLYQAWIENSIKGEAADVVFCIPETGFITCLKSGKHTGEIVLIGIKEGMRGKGLGTALIAEALHWFGDQGIRTVNVRTQLRNPGAVNFYISLGFFLERYDLIFGKILSRIIHNNEEI